ncbi:TIGR01777 family oxidoreductase [Amycolatopsis sp. NPDC004378]
MTAKFSSVVDAPLDEVFAWHGRPGAIVRLMPPWQPVRVAEEAGSLRNGRAELVLPTGLKWAAEHQPDDFEASRKFVDSLETPVLSTLLRWRHTHCFESVDDCRTRVTDTVETRLPMSMLWAMFAYRHRQLAWDLTAHQRYGGPPMTVAITGVGGLVGTALSALLSTGGHRVVKLVRRQPRSSGERLWNPAAPDAELLAGIDAVVHLAGASIAGRFDSRHKAKILHSRVGPTRALAELAARTVDGPRVFVSASAIGFYGPDRGDEPLTEESERGEGFLADVVSQWEAAATEPARAAGLKVAKIRTGLVLSPRGGLLRLQYPLFALGLGGRLGQGGNRMSWIGIDDLTDIYLRALTDPELTGPVNAVAVEPVTNEDYTSTLAALLHRPALIRVPAFGPRMLLGREGAGELALADQRVLPRRLIHNGHRYRTPRLKPALAHVLGRDAPDAEFPRLD